jgi:hypothetical protein
MSEVKSSAPIRTILRERKRAFGGSEREHIGELRSAPYQETQRDVNRKEGGGIGTTYKLNPTGKTRPSTSLNSPG